MTSSPNTTFEPNGKRDEGIPFAPELPNVTCEAVIDAVRLYLDMTDDEADYVKVALAVAVAHALADEEPLWVILVGPPGGGKTEALRLLRYVAHAQPDELTRAGFLSWSGTGAKAKRAGLLTKIPEHAFCTISDFSTVITMGDHEARARMFGALRVIYDGNLRRDIGGGGPGDLDWEGHLTLLAGSTNAIDTHMSFEAALGERWLLFRLPESDLERSRNKARYHEHREEAKTKREQARKLAAALVNASRERIPPHLSEETMSALADAATFVARARVGVQFEGSGKWRVPVGYPMPEEPTRVVGQMHRLARCLVALGEDEREALRLAIGAGLDSVPQVRLKALVHAIKEAATVSSTHRAIGRGNRWGAKWELMALEAAGLVDVDGPEEEDDPSATRLYRAKDGIKQLYQSIAAVVGDEIADNLEDEFAGVFG